MYYDNQYDVEKSLINFRIPNSFREAFEVVCKYKSQTKTQTMVDLIREYLDSEYPKIEEDMAQQNSMLNFFHKRA